MTNDLMTKERGHNAGLWFYGSLLVAVNLIGLIRDSQNSKFLLLCSLILSFSVLPMVTKGIENKFDLKINFPTKYIALVVCFCLTIVGTNGLKAENDKKMVQNQSLSEKVELKAKQNSEIQGELNDITTKIQNHQKALAARVAAGEITCFSGYRIKGEEALPPCEEQRENASKSESALQGDAGENRTVNPNFGMAQTQLAAQINSFGTMSGISKSFSLFEIPMNSRHFLACHAIRSGYCGLYEAKQNSDAKSGGNSFKFYAVDDEARKVSKKKLNESRISKQEQSALETKALESIGEIFFVPSSVISKHFSVINLTSEKQTPWLTLTIAIRGDEWPVGNGARTAILTELIKALRKKLSPEQIAVVKMVSLGNTPYAAATWFPQEEHPRFEFYN